MLHVAASSGHSKASECIFVLVEAKADLSRQNKGSVLCE